MLLYKCSMILNILERRDRSGLRLLQAERQDHTAIQNAVQFCQCDEVNRGYEEDYDYEEENDDCICCPVCGSKDCELLHIKESEIGDYFFTRNVQYS